MADLDHFKAVNDRFSHAVGDAALRAIAKILPPQVRHTDLVARFGGEEFVIVLVETDAEAAPRVCEKLRAAIAQHDWTAIHPGLRSRCRIGVARGHDAAGPRARCSRRPTQRSTPRRRRAQSRGGRASG